MTRDPFENQLESLFAQPPRFDDTAAFALGVERRLAQSARWRTDLTAAAWIVAGGATLFAAVLSLDTPTVAAATAQVAAAIAAAPDVGGGWLLPVLAIGLVLGVQALDDQLVRD